MDSWFGALEEALCWSTIVADAVGRQPAVFDVGGGWPHDDFAEILVPSLGQLREIITKALPSAKRVLLEPGKALSTPTAVLLASILEVRRRPRIRAGLDVVVNASIADLPMHDFFAHRIILRRC